MPFADPSPKIGDSKQVLLRKLLQIIQGQSDEGGGGYITQVQGDARYFKLDGSNSPFTRTSATVVTVPDAFILTGLGSIGLTAGGSNKNVTITPSGTGETRFSDAAGSDNYIALSASSTTNKIYSRQQGSGASFISEVYSDSASAGIVGRRIKNTIASPGTVIDGDTLVFLGGAGYDSSAITTSRASVALLAAGTWTTISTPSRISFNTTSAASTANTARWTVEPTGALAAPSTNTAGLQLYSTADQVTNVQRLEVLYGSSVAQIGTRTIGTAASTPIHLFSQAQDGQLTYSRLDVVRGAAFPILRQGLFTSSTNTTNGSTALTGTAVSFGNFTSIATSGTTTVFSLTPTYNQASGTASNTDFLINRTETAVGSGIQNFIQLQVSGSNRVQINSNGSAAFSGGFASGSSSPQLSLVWVGGALSRAAWGLTGPNLSVVANTVTDTSTAGSGTATNAVFTSFAQPTLAATNSLVTTTDAATVYIANGPAAGTNQTITNGYALWVDNGTCRFDGAIRVSMDVATPANVSNTASVRIGSAGVGLFIGTGNPSNTAAKGSIYIRTDATTTTTRLWMNTDGAGTWTNLTTAA